MHMSIPQIQVAATLKRPFRRDFHLIQDDMATVRELEGKWAACLDSLCGRLRTASRMADGAGKIPSTSTALRPNFHSHDWDPGDEFKREWKWLAGASREPSLPTGSPGSAATSSPKAMGPTSTMSSLEFRAGMTCRGRPAAGTPDQARRIALTEHEQTASRTQATASANMQRTTEASIRFDRSLLRVGARVPWGPPHKGRFVKVGNKRAYESRQRRSSIDGEQFSLEWVVP